MDRTGLIVASSGSTGLSTCRVFAELIKIGTTQIRDHNSLAFRPVCAPFKTRLLKILNNEIFVELERRDGISELCRAAVGFVKIEKCKADAVASVEQLASR